MTKAIAATGAYTTLALALDLAMANDEHARRIYFHTYGEEWVPLTTQPRASGLVTASTTARTVR